MVYYLFIYLFLNIRELQENILSNYYLNLFENWKAKLKFYLNYQKETKSKEDNLIKGVLKLWFEKMDRHFNRINGVIEIKANSELHLNDLEVNDENLFYRDYLPPILFRLPNYGKLKEMLFLYFNQKKKI